MITNATEMLKALKRGTYCGVILYQGPSMIDGAPIAAPAVARRPRRASITIIAHGTTAKRFAAAA